ncbi:hypothetical protein GCM10023206_23140 [Acinetobacter puyangensis]|uniref:Xylose isomerase-like TIM barrel n=1 Tax=Acinetobacter puyangensis TaxID=1096779 RepID=A0A240ECL9_9GAMM|nr:TIM barrel protein [Acinetobacter puyangensis]SNX46296.1 Xylose isomerase-like TIM barrel [Acinetobacter puyangensis]
MKKMFPLGCAGLGIQSSSIENPVSLIEPTIEEKFNLLKDSEVWDFLDHIPINEQQIDAYIKASQNVNLPIYSGYGLYTLGDNEKNEFKKNIELTHAVGAKYHNVMLSAKDINKTYISNDQVAELYLHFYEYADKKGITITFENHVDNWSEDYRRVLQVADIVESKGVRFNMAMDYSHCIFKIENEIEIFTSGFRGNNEAIMKLDPYNSNSYADDWLNRQLITWAQIRPAVPNGPRNWWAGESCPWDGLGNDRPGRSIQYPFSQPKAGEWHTEFWHAHKLACTKEIIRKVIDHYLYDPLSNIKLMTVDNINLWSYGLGWKYNMFNDSCLVAQYIREIYAERAAIYEAKKDKSSNQFVEQYRL